MPKPVMTIVEKATGKVTSEIYMLNPGEGFAGFGGSRGGIVVGKTASLIVRNRQGGQISDIEYDIYDAGVWAWIARLINDPTLGVEAKT